MPKGSFAVYWTETAFRDLDGIVDRIALDAIDRALSVYQRIKNKSNTLALFPFRGRVVPELQSNGIVTYRELIVSPWRVIYRVGDTAVYVVSVFDGRRNIEDVLFARLIEPGS